MVRYIDTEPLEAEQYKGFNRVSETDWQKGYWSGIDEMCDKIKEQPTADVVEVVHGEWSHLGGDEWCCTNCGEVIHTEGSWEKPEKKFCHECGAKMDGKKVE